MFFSELVERRKQEWKQKQTCTYKSFRCRPQNKTISSMNIANDCLYTKAAPTLKKVKCVFRYFAVGWISLNNQSSTVFFLMLWLYCNFFAPSRHIAPQNLKRITNIVLSTTPRNRKEICNNAPKVKSYFPSIDRDRQITQVVFGSNKHLLALDYMPS